LRGEGGANFAVDVSDDAKAGTLRNMLSAAGLNAVQFPDTAIGLAQARRPALIASQ
jgi:hypothetical protein